MTGDGEVIGGGGAETQTGPGGHILSTVRPLCHPDPAEPGTDKKIQSKRSTGASLQRTGRSAKMLQKGPPGYPVPPSALMTDSAGLES